MENQKDNKRGFWRLLFSPKPCSCSCNDNLIKRVSPENRDTVYACANTPAAPVKEIKILGPGCAKCKTTYQVIEKVIGENNLDVKLTKIEDITEIMSYNVMGTPAVVVDGVVKIKGYVPSEGEVRRILGV